MLDSCTFNSFDYRIFWWSFNILVSLKLLYFSFFPKSRCNKFQFGQLLDRICLKLPIIKFYIKKRVSLGLSKVYCFTTIYQTTKNTQSKNCMYYVSWDTIFMYWTAYLWNCVYEKLLRISIGDKFMRVIILKHQIIHENSTLMLIML